MNHSLTHASLNLQKYSQFNFLKFQLLSLLNTDQLSIINHQIFTTSQIYEFLEISFKLLTIIKILIKF